MKIKFHPIKRLKEYYGGLALQSTQSYNILGLMKDSLKKVQNQGSSFFGSETIKNMYVCKNIS